MLVAVVLLAYAACVRGQATLGGQSGLIHMPDARISPEGTWRFGASYEDPYFSVWSSLSFYPFLELSGAYTTITGVTGFPGTENEDDYGDYKDKAIGLKLRLLSEGRYWPQIAIGGDDLFGTQIFHSQYVVASKRLWELDLTLGYGRDRIDGAFGGLRYTPKAFPSLSFVAEYNAYDYSDDQAAGTTGVINRDKGPVAGLEYRWKWLTAQVGYGQDEVTANAYLSVPLMQREFVSKVNEPLPYTKITPRPTLAQWRSDASHGKRMARALYDQNFKAIRIAMDGTTLRVELTNTRISQMSRAVGRAARTILLTSPIETRELQITYTIADLPFATYTFSDLDKLQRYFNGMIPRAEIMSTVSIRYADPQQVDAELSAAVDMLDAFQPGYSVSVLDDTEGDIVSFSTEGASLGGFRISPKLAFFFNDPSGGALLYEFYILGSYRRELLERLFFDVGVRLTVAENLSNVTTLSNSTLPHVRTDINFYLQDENFISLERLLLNRYFAPAPRVYARASVGYYEQMYAGVGGQVLYLSESGRWAADLAVDYVRQRDFDGGFGFLDYTTVTGLLSVHAKLPILADTYGTVRAGRFLAKDWGARFEAKRRFGSGIEVGFWYTLTNGDDITSPGAPGDPYYDKGVFVNIPLSPFMLKDTQAVAQIALAPWVRDVGQMVVSPADLYWLFERPERNLKEEGGMVNFGDFGDRN
jgi:hypothetical protein